MAASKNGGGSTAVARRDTAIASLGDMLKAKKDNLRKVIPPNLGLDVERLVRMTIGAVARSPDLLVCSAPSIYAAVYDAVQWGIDPVSPQGYGYLVPRWNKNTKSKEASFQVGYKGLIHLARRFGCVSKVVANVVVEGEEFEFDPVAGEVRHRFDPKLDHTKEETFIAAYAIAWPKDPGLPPAAICLDRQQVLARRNASATSGGIWNQWPDRMWRKTAIRALFSGGEVELSPEFAQILEHDYEVDRDDEPQRTIEVSESRGMAALEMALDATEQEESEDEDRRFAAQMVEDAMDYPEAFSETEGEA